MLSKMIKQMIEEESQSSEANNNPNIIMNLSEQPQSSSEAEITTRKIIVFDGQIDSTWIDYLNVISCHRKHLHLPDNSSLNLYDFKIIFETLNLKNCTPSFVNYY